LSMIVNKVIIVTPNTKTIIGNNSVICFVR
jgi:hypothetical protein